MNSSSYDVVYYWVGGTENGEWRDATPNVWPEYKPVDVLRAEIERMGYKAVYGCRRIGPPEGAPSA